MAEVIEAVRLTGSEKLPDELSGFESIGKDERGHLVGIYEDGGTKGINQLGSLLMKTLVGVGAAEEITPEPESPEVAALKDRVQELERQLDEEKQSHAAELRTLREEFERQFKEQDKQIGDLRREFDALRKRRTSPKPTVPPPGTVLGRGNLKDGVWFQKPSPPPQPLVSRRQVPEEEIQWYRRRPATAVLGGLATAAAVVAAGFGIWNHHELEELEHRQPAPAEAVIPDNGFGTPSVLESKGYHLSYFNQNRGRKVTGVWVPKDVNVVGSPGNYKLVKNGVTLVQKVEWDSQGKLTHSTMTQLRKKDGYNVGWSFLKGDRKVSIVLNR